MTQLSEDLLFDLIDRAYEASLDPQHWVPLLDKLAETFNGKAALFFQDLSRGDSDFSITHGFEPEYLATYVKYYGHRSPWLARLSHLPAGTTVTAEMLADRSGFEKSEFYADWIVPQNLYSAVGAILEKSDAVATNIAINCDLRHGPITTEEYRFFERLTPHLRRAVRVGREIFAARLQRDSAVDALDKLAVAVLMTDHRGRLAFANRRGEQLLRDGDVLSLQNGFVRARTPALSRELLQQIHAAAGLAAELDCGTHIRLVRPDGSAVSVLVNPVRSGLSIPSPVLPAALLFVNDTRDEPMIGVSTLMQLYGLTKAEAALLAALLRGTTLQSYAEGVQASLNTVKTHLKNVFAKTGQNRQSDLIRAVLSNPVLRLLPG